MKIQTQARILTTGSVLVPLILVLIVVSYQYFEGINDLNAYEDVFTLMDENTNAHDRELFTRFVLHSARFSEVTIFRDDYFVLHSTNPEFNSNVYADRVDVLSRIETGKEPFDYIFVSRKLDDNRVYVLNRIGPPEHEQKFFPLFIPFLIFTILLTLFCICISFVITRTITRSVLSLENTTRRISEGELNLNIDVKGSNEITSLANSLNKMRISLKEEELRRSRFIMGISHDLKTPLSLIKGYTQAIKDGMTKNYKTRSDALDLITAKSDQLEEMINDLINFARMETTEWQSLLDEINVNFFLKDMEKTLKEEIEFLQCKLITNISLPENLHVLMDEHLVQRAIRNIIDNAVRYSAPGSSIRCTASLVENEVKLTISDEGMGINEKDLPHIFDMFYRSSSSRQERGMGLGLAVVKWVVDFHGWSIDVLSEEGKGTEFTITIPIIKST